MSPGITKLQLTDVSSISIPTDSILILSVLIFCSLLGYFFHNILDNQINQLIRKVDDNSLLELVTEKLENELSLESAITKQDKSEKPNFKKINFLPPSKFLGISSLAFIAIGGSSLLRIQTIQNSYREMNTSQMNIKTENQLAKSLVSIVELKPSKKSQTKLKNISYVDPLLSTNNNKIKINFLNKIKKRNTEDFFSF
tara:strand:- start:396 stop:989 length:594 start_codon:yes stop_codon:yes gene_type:complete